MFAGTILDQSSGSVDFLWNIINTIYFNPLQLGVAYLFVGTPWKHQKTFLFLMLSGGIDKQHRAVMGSRS